MALSYITDQKPYSLDALLLMVVRNKNAQPDLSSEEGMREAQIMMARNLLKNGVSLELIIESTGLSREDLISLQ